MILKSTKASHRINFPFTRRSTFAPPACLALSAQDDEPGSLQQGKVLRERISLPAVRAERWLPAAASRRPVFAQDA